MVFSRTTPILLPARATPGLVGELNSSAGRTRMNAQTSKWWRESGSKQQADFRFDGGANRGLTDSLTDKATQCFKSRPSGDHY